MRERQGKPVRWIRVAARVGEERNFIKQNKGSFKGKSKRTKDTSGTMGEGILEEDLRREENEIWV